MSGRARPSGAVTVAASRASDPAAESQNVAGVGPPGLPDEAVRRGERVGDRHKGEGARRPWGFRLAGGGSPGCRERAAGEDAAEEKPQHDQGHRSQRGRGEVPARPDRSDHPGEGNASEPAKCQQADPGHLAGCVGPPAAGRGPPSPPGARPGAARPRRRADHTGTWDQHSYRSGSGRAGDTDLVCHRCLLSAGHGQLSTPTRVTRRGRLLVRMCMTMPSRTQRSRTTRVVRMSSSPKITSQFQGCQ